MIELSALKLNGFIFGETTPLFPFLPSFSLGVNSWGEEFAPREQILSFES